MISGCNDGSSGVGTVGDGSVACSTCRSTPPVEVLTTGTAVEPDAIDAGTIESGATAAGGTVHGQHFIETVAQVALRSGLLDVRPPQLVPHDDQHDQTQRHEDATGRAEVGAPIAPVIEAAIPPRDEGVERRVVVGCWHVGAECRTAHSTPTRDSASGGDLVPEMSRHRERTLAGCGRRRFRATRQTPPSIRRMMATTIGGRGE